MQGAPVPSGERTEQGHQEKGLGCGCFFVLDGGQRLKDALDLLHHLGVVLRVKFGEADHGTRYGKLDVLEDLGAGDANSLAGFILCPHATVLAKSGSDDGGRLACEGPGAEGTGQPVDGVLEGGGDGAVVLGGDQEEGVSVGGSLTEGGGFGGNLAFDVDVLVVERDVAERVVDTDVNVFRSVQRDGFGELLVVGISAEAADEGEDGALGHCVLLGRSWAFTDTKRTTVRFLFPGSRMIHVSFIPLRPDVPSEAPHERRDAARNRELLLSAARELVEELGAEALTMDALACKAKVGKGTVFRRFGSRAGLMMTLLSDSESEFQRGFMFGPPPLGPGAPPRDRLVAFGEGRIYFFLEYGDLWKAAGASTRDRYEAPATALAHRHVEMLLREADLPDPWVLAMTLISALDPDRIVNDVRVRGISPKRLTDSWGELVRRLVPAA